MKGRNNSNNLAAALSRPEGVGVSEAINNAYTFRLITINQFPLLVSTNTYIFERSRFLTKVLPQLHDKKLFNHIYRFVLLR